MNKLVLGIFVLFTFFTSALVLAKDNVSYPLPSGYINDSAGLIRSQDQNAISAFSKELQAKTTNQLAVVTVSSTQPLTIEQYAVELFKRWGIGQKGKDNGVLFVIAAQDHTLRIEVGYGLESILTDAICSTIIRQIVVPEFKQGHLSLGILEGTKAIVSLIAKENGVTITGQENEIYGSLHEDNSYPWVIVLVFILFFTFYAHMFSRSGRGPWGGGYFGGGFGGGGYGSGGGGFGGFGGGSSGGGGASGRW